MKNKMMRIASVLLVAVLLSTCAISGTFAKYVTSTSAEDTARVAKFGVQLAVVGDSLFSNEYATDDSNYTGSVSVKSIDDAKVVAPGTNSGDTGVTFAISGTPEVATKIDITMEVTNDIFLKAGTYKDFTVSPYTGTFTIDKDYYPVVFTLTQNGEELVSGSLAEVEEFINDYAATAYYAPNTVLDATFNLTWEWAFEQEEVALMDKADTLLGDLAANADYFGEGILVAGTDYSTEIAYTITISVTQVD